MKALRVVAALFIATAALAALPVLAGAESPDSVRYTAHNEDSKVRLAVRGDKIANTVSSLDAVCRRNGEIVEPYYGSGVTSGFNPTSLTDSGHFVSQQKYHRRSPLTHRVEKMTRRIEGQIDGATGTAVVNIRYDAPLYRLAKPTAKCRTGRVEFDLKRIG